MAMPARRDPERCNSVCAQENTETDSPNSVPLVPQRGCYGNRKSCRTEGVCAQRAEPSRTRMSRKPGVESEVWVATWATGRMLGGGGWGRDAGSGGTHGLKGGLGDGDWERSEEAGRAGMRRVHGGWWRKGGGIQGRAL